MILSARDDVLRVPTQALLEGGRVLVLEGDCLVERQLQAGLRNRDMTEVVSGLAARDRVVTSLDRPEIKAGRAPASRRPTGASRCADDPLSGLSRSYDVGGEPVHASWT